MHPPWVGVELYRLVSGTLELGTKEEKGWHEGMKMSGLLWNVSFVGTQPLPSPPGSGEPLIYTKEFCWNVTDWFGSLAEEVDTADSRTTCILEPSLFCLTFSVTLTLRRLRVEKPEEHSVSVGELGHEWVARVSCSSTEVPVPLQIRDMLSTS